VRAGLVSKIARARGSSARSPRSDDGRIMQRLTEPALYRDAPGELKTLQARLRAVESELALKLERWEKLETLNSPARAPVK
jgi:hypothetical protein